MSSHQRRENERRKSVRAGVITTVVLLASLAFAITAQNGMPEYLPGVERTELRAEFTNSGALRRGDDVRIADVRVGFVEEITRRDGVALVTMKLDGGREVYKNARAAIAARSALGQKFVDLEPGTPDKGRLEQGAVLPLSRTRTAVELDTVLGTLDHKTLMATQGLLRQTGGGLAGHGEDLQVGLTVLPDMLDDLATVSRSLAAEDGQDLSELLRAADTLAGTLEAQDAELGSLVQSTSVTLDAVNVDDGAPLETALAEAPAAMSEVRGALENLDEPLRRTASAARALRPGAVALGGAMPDVRALLRSAVPVLDKVPGVAEKTEPAEEDLAATLQLARPLVLQVSTALDRASLPLATLSPYAPEIALLFRNLSDALRWGDEAGNWLRFTAVINTQTATGVLPITDPMLRRDPYPAPGEAQSHYTSPLGGN